jgi:AraC-like DNA-binding protein
LEHWSVPDPRAWIGRRAACGVIAAAHFISKRYLFALFSGQGSTVSAHIRDLRLEHCRQDLADPALAGQAVGMIGTRWGFSSAAHFSRVFRDAHGIPPGEYRLLTVKAAAHPGYGSWRLDERALNGG